MDVLFFLIGLTAFIFMIIGFFSPKRSLFWYKKERNRFTSFVIYFTINTVSFIISASFMANPSTSETPKITSTDKYERLKDSLVIVLENRTEKNKVIKEKQEKQAELDAERNERIQKETERQNKLKKEAKENRDFKLESCFSAFDGSHRGLEKYIKKLMYYPDSYSHIETSYYDRDSIIVVIAKYRAKSQYGTMQIFTTEANTDINGNVLNIVETTVE